MTTARHRIARRPLWGSILHLGKLTIYLGVGLLAAGAWAILGLTVGVLGLCAVAVTLGGLL